VARRAIIVRQSHPVHGEKKADDGKNGDGNKNGGEKLSEDRIREGLKEWKEQQNGGQKEGNGRKEDAPRKHVFKPFDAPLGEDGPKAKKPFDAPLGEDGPKVKKPFDAPLGEDLPKTSDNRKVHENRKDHDNRKNHDGQKDSHGR